MPTQNKFYNYTRFVFLMVFLVIIAGGVVRMTQSGMGCPDWPRCFGRWVPPTSAEQLPPDFEKYLDKQDIDHTFNVYHTWIEYINRLLGALLGVFIFIHFIWSFKKFRKNRTSIVWLSFLLLIAVGFQGWLGKKVVDHNLEVAKITTHMLVAIFIAAIPFLILHLLKPPVRVQNKFLKWGSVFLLFIVLVQIVFGTQVREQIDEISKSLMYDQRELWIERLGKEFNLHRSFSWVVVLATAIICWKMYFFPSLRKQTFALAFVVIITIVVGIIMAWFNIPALAQPMHLLLACILSLQVFDLFLRVK